MIKKEKIYILLISLMMIISTLSYGVHIYHLYYKYFQVIISLLIIFTMFIFLKFDNSLKKETSKKIFDQFYIILMLLLMVGNTIFGYLIYKYNYPFSIISTILFAICALAEFYAMPAICNKNKKIENKIISIFIRLCLILSLTSIFIELSNGKFLTYKFVSYRNASVFYDPNFAAMIFGTCFFILLKNNNIKNKLLKFIYLTLIGITIFLTGSRGTMVSIIMTIFIYIFIYNKMKFGKKMFVGILFCIVAFLFIRHLFFIDFFRIYQGSNYRIDMWVLTIKEIIRQPLFGHGYEAIKTFLNTNGYMYASTHNSYIDFAFAYGLPCFLLYIYLIISLLIRAIKSKKTISEKYILVMLFSMINANTILYSFGGVGISSVLFTFSLGMVNYSLEEIKEKKNEDVKYNSSSL